MSYRDKRHTRGVHPGWAIQFADGSWLGGAHGWFTSDDAAYADVHDTEEEAKSSLKYVRLNHKDCAEFQQDAKVVPAWEHLVSYLQNDIHFLKKTSQVKRETVDEITEALEEALYTLKAAQKTSKEDEE